VGAIAIAAVVIAAGGTAAGLHLSRTGNVSPVADASTATGRATPAPSAPPSTLTSVLKRTAESTRMLTMSACAQQTTVLDQCTNPSPAIASVTFATYPTLAALYAKYQEIVRNLTGGQPFAAAENLRVCGPAAPAPTAESTWNNANEYFTTYTTDQLTAGEIPTATAMGRVFCGQTANGSTVILWTQDSGNLLGYATGGDVPYGQVWQWFGAVHTSISFPSQPGATGGPTAPPGTTPGLSVSVVPLPGGTG
jgi:CHASE2 domain-containing sensor protein